MHRCWTLLLLVACVPTSPPSAPGAPDADTAAPTDGSGTPRPTPQPTADTAAPTDTRSAGFFVTSVGSGAAGGDLGGLAGADARCQSLAGAAGLGAQAWRAYLSTSPIGATQPIDARDRIGAGPWRDVAGRLVARDVDALHADGIPHRSMLTELGEPVPGDEHDVLTGSDPSGRHLDAFPGNPSAPGPTCLNWTSRSGDAYTMVGHSDWSPADSWSASHTTTCSAAGLASTAGSGRLYCFAL